MIARTDRSPNSSQLHSPEPRSRRPLIACGAALLALAASLWIAPQPARAQSYDPASAPAAYEDPGLEGQSYTYFREVDGTARLIQVGSGEEQEVEPNQPALTGDRLQVPPGSRLELVLSDGTLVRVGGGTDLVFEALAGSPDAAAAQSRLRLLTGHLQLVVFADSGADEPPAVEVGTATIYTRGQGVYRITAEGGEHARVTVRDGSAELVTERGSLVVRAGEQGWTEGGDWPRAGVQAAAAEDALERWGDSLVARAELAVDRGYAYGNDSLRYAAAPLEDYGDWILVGGNRAWRPRVEVGWRPYWSGRWAYTPSGWFWVSSEPWGWVPYHYGSWNLHPSYGWVWYPGDVFAPAWVYWYWGPSQVAWVPIGYYSHYYADYGFAHRHNSFFGFRFGFYGYAGGRADYYRNWVFCPIDRFRHHGHHRDFYRGDDYHRRTRRDVVPRGVITTDTRRITRDRLLQPVQLVDELGREGNGRRTAVRRGEGPPDVTSFVAREPELNPELRNRLVARTPDQGSRLNGTPLRPGSVRRAGPTARTPHRVSPEATANPTPRRDPASPTPSRIRPEAPSRPTSIRPSTPSRPSSVTPTSPRRPTSVRPSAPSGAQRPSSIRPSTPSRPSSVTPTSPRRPTSVRPSAPSGTQRPSSVRPSTPSRPSSARPATPRSSARQIQPTSPRSSGARASGASRSPSRGSSPRATSDRGSSRRSPSASPRGGSGDRSSARSASRSGSPRGSSGKGSPRRSGGGGN